MSIVAALSLLSLSETDYRGVKIDFSQLPDTAKKRTRKRAPTNVLVTGGAGYIGSHTVLEMLMRTPFVCVVAEFEWNS